MAPHSWGPFTPGAILLGAIHTRLHIPRYYSHQASYSWGPLTPGAIFLGLFIPDAIFLGLFIPDAIFLGLFTPGALFLWLFTSGAIILGTVHTRRHIPRYYSNQAPYS